MKNSKKKPEIWTVLHKFFLSVMMSRLFGKFFFYGQTVLVHFSLAVYPLFLSLSSWLLFLPIKDLVMWWLRLKLPCVIVQSRQALETNTIRITMNFWKSSLFFFLNSLQVTIAKVFSLRILLFFWSNFKEYCIPSYNQSPPKYILFHGTKEVADCFLCWIFCWNFFVH